MCADRTGTRVHDLHGAPKDRSEARQSQTKECGSIYTRAH